MQESEGRQQNNHGMKGRTLWHWLTADNFFNNSEMVSCYYICFEMDAGLGMVLIRLRLSQIPTLRSLGPKMFFN